ncbi:alkaline phosphatase D family protein [Zhihengliuella halotolerans]|uniref:Alkaline phosphatase D n=1 Tax=Zhihengliuella halotolerans TaxID=370736 RepID=A0A4Q8AGU7_9MICC|nr:alkaline phosphatase D family protein [Zhihengliuella halotolerans]RZU63617.1 alkaline phosphatase D [Zhihengliuella halotolerans]
MAHISRRSLVLGSLAAGATGLAAAVTATPAGASGLLRPAAPSLVRSRLSLPSGIQFGDAGTDSAVLWSRSSGPGRLVAKLRAVDAQGAVIRGKGAFQRTLRGPWATEDSDFTAKIAANRLPSGSRFAVTMAFEDEHGTLGEAADGTFTTAAGPNAAGRSPARGGDVPRGQSFVWTGDTAGQGWGINEEIGGMFAYSAMRATKPDFFVHSGDTVYADGPLEETVVEPDGQVWRNLVTEEVSKVAETLDEFRGNHRYNLMDANVRAFYSEVPVIAQWDDHETTNNWWHGEILEDDRYTVRDVDTLAARGRRAWQEYQPIANPRAMARGTGFEPARIYRKIERGAQLDLFCLDMRTFKSENTAGLESHATSILGEEQLQWLIKGVKKSKATWKVILADLPLGIIVPDGDAQESISNADHGAPLGRELELARLLKAFKAAGVKNIVWLTADVHYCAAHHYSPERAAFTDFDPFWEFVAGPISAGSFGPNKMDGTFGPDVVFAKAGERPNQSPRDGKSQFFGHVALDEADTFTVSLRNGLGETVFTRILTPER